GRGRLGQDGDSGPASEAKGLFPELARVVEAGHAALPNEAEGGKTHRAAYQKDGERGEEDLDNQAGAAIICELVDRGVRRRGGWAGIGGDIAVVRLFGPVVREEVGVVAVRAADRRLGGGGVELDPAEAGK